MNAVESQPADSGLYCDICESPLVQSTAPDARTLALWGRHICRSCGDRLDVPTEQADASAVR